MAAICLSLAWLVGVLVGFHLALPLAFAIIGLPSCVAGFFFRRRRKLLIICGLAVAVLVTGTWFYRWIGAPAAPAIVSRAASGNVEIRGTVGRDPEIGPANTLVTLSITDINDAGEWKEISGGMLITVPRYPEYRYGDVLNVKGELEVRPSNSASSDQSSYWDYLANQDIYATMFYPSVQVTERGKGSPFLNRIYDVRRSLLSSLGRVLPEPHASLAQGIVLGSRANIPSSLKNSFIGTGTAHLLAISGVNLTIVAGILVSITLWFFGRRRYFYIWLTLIVVWLYAFLTGLATPVLRAAIMLTFFLVADVLGRQRNGFAALALAAAIMVGLNPKSLNEASFQLSFAAMAGLVFVFPRLQSASAVVLERFVPEGKLRYVATPVLDSFGVSLAAVVATWPLTAHYFGLVSWVGPVATFFALPAMSLIIVTCILSGGFGFVFLPLGQIVGWLAWLALSYLIVVVTWFAAVPGASLHIGTLPPAAIFFYYAAMAAAFLAYRHRKRAVVALRPLAEGISRFPLKWVLPPLAVAALFPWVFFSTMPDNNVHVTFLDVGQGDAILIERGNHQVLIDGGPHPQPVITEMGRKMPFWDRTLDAVVLTHPDSDHLTGLVEVLKRYRVGQVVSTNMTDDSPLFQEWENTVDSKAGSMEAAFAGQTISLGKDATLYVLNPASTIVSDSDVNNNCIVLRLDVGKVSFLFTGDLGTDGESELIAGRANLRSDVLKVGHHGSATSTSEAFLDVVNPSVVVISVGKGNSYGHPNTEVLSRLTKQLGTSNIYRTDEDGSIEFITNGEKLWVKTE